MVPQPPMNPRLQLKRNKEAQQLIKALNKVAQSKVELMFLDETTHSQMGKLNAWSHVNKPIIMENIRFARNISVLAIMNIDGIVYWEQQDHYFSLEELIAFLKRFKKQLPQNKKVALLMDNLGIHRNIKTIQYIKR